MKKLAPERDVKLLPAASERVKAVKTWLRIDDGSQVKITQIFSGSGKIAYQTVERDESAYLMPPLEEPWS
jgi:hypothetical protein